MALRKAGDRHREIWAFSLPNSGFEASAFGTQITVNIAATTMSDLEELWSRDVDGAKECACVTLASVLLHELWHTCGNTIGDGFFRYPCSRAQLIEHNFLYAISQWYPEVLDHCACASYSDEDLWFDAGEEPAAGGGYTHVDPFNGACF